MSSQKRRGLAALITLSVLTGGALSVTTSSSASSGGDDRGAAVAAASPAAAPARFALDPVVPDTVIRNTQVRVTGRLGEKSARKVVLEIRTSSKRRVLAKGKSKKNGTFAFSKVKLTETGQLVAVSPKQTVKGDTSKAAKRALAKAKAKQKAAAKKVRQTKAAVKKARSKKAKIKAQKAHKAAVKALNRAKKATQKAKDRIRKVYKRSESNPVPVAVVAGQSSTAAALPPVAQAGATPAAPRTDAVVSFKFVPARAGRTVRLEELVNGSWSQVATQGQDRSGHAVFSVPAGRTYRARTDRTTELAQVVSSVVTTKSYTLDFSDTFDGSALDPSTWVAQQRPVGTGMRSCARTDGSSYSVGGGVLRLGVSYDPTRSDACSYVDGKGQTHLLPYMRNTQIATERNYTYQYGTLAARVKVQSAVGMHSAVWSQPLQGTVPGDPARGIEADVMEYFGDSLGADTPVASFQHVLRADGTLEKIGGTFPESAKMKGTEAFSANYHVFSLEWTPTAYVFRVDGREYHRSTRDISHTPQYLLLSNLTSSYELVNLTDVDDVASVDWVQVWK